ncbi:MAG TPA: hypothetical protein VJV74_13495 [Terriglobia bacterium]|nr:hypothetical protein [Terriglobia bacterium]
MLTPMMMFLATLVTIAFVSTALSFLVLVWRLSWSMQGFVATELQRAKYEERIVAMLHDYIDVQRQTNEQLWMALDVHSDRLNRWTEKRVQGAAER